jgi:serine/threonine protein phosphatase 1
MTSQCYTVSACPDHPLWIIGDVHGRFNAFSEAYELFQEARAHDPLLKLILLGDLIDRGPESLKCLQLAVTIRKAYPNTVLLLGNHEQMMYGALRPQHEEQHKDRCLRNWLNNGGGWISEVLPELDLILDQLPPTAWQSHYMSGDVICVHAGIPPHVAHDEVVDFLNIEIFRLPNGSGKSLHHPCWLRGHFLRTEQPHKGHYICHGHSASAFEGHPLAGRVNLDGSCRNEVVCAHLSTGKLEMHQIRNMTPQPTQAFPTEPKTIAKAIQVELSCWAGNCHAIALKLMAAYPVRGMRYARGHWRGVTAGQFEGRALTGHTWLQLADGRIVDPTRYVFEGVAPYIYIGPKDDNYDEAGLKTRHRAIPQPSLGDISITNQEAEHLQSQGILGINNTLSIPAAQWLSTTPLHDTSAKANFKLLNQAGLKALIPLDSWRAIMEPSTLTAKVSPQGWFHIPEVKVAYPKIAHFLITTFVLPTIDEAEYYKEDELITALDSLNCITNMDELYVSHAQKLGLILSIVGEGNAAEVESAIQDQGWTIDHLHTTLVTLGKRGDLELGWL